MARTSESYFARPMAINSSLKIGGNHINGFLASAAGTMTITDDDGIIIIQNLPLAVGFNRIPVNFYTATGGTIALGGGATGALLT